MSVTISEVVGRIGVYINSSGNLKVRPQNLRKTLKFNHLNLHRIVPNILREYLTTYENITVVADASLNPFYATLDLTTMDHVPKEISSVTFAGDATTSSQAYEKALGREHFRGLDAYDEEELEGRYWWSERGGFNASTFIAEPKLEIYQGSTVRSTAAGAYETPLEVGFVREMYAVYSTAAEYTSNKALDIDLAPELVEYLVKLTAHDCIKEKLNQESSYLGQDLRREEDRLIQMDAVIDQGLKTLEAQNKDIR